MVGSGLLFGRFRALHVKKTGALRRRSAAPLWLLLLLVTSALAACYGASADDNEGDSGANGGTAANGGANSGTGTSSGGNASGAEGGSASGAEGGSASDAEGGSASGAEGGSDASGGTSSGGSASGGTTGGSGGVLSGATPCLSDDACASEGLFCLEGNRVCVECTSDSECAAGTWCDREKCVPFDPCTGDEQCGGDVPICYENASSGGRCVPCFGNTGCPEGESCHAEYCAPLCSDHADCVGRGQVCHLAGGYCAECYLDAGCDADEFCNLRVCRPRRCTPGQTRCLGGQIVTCETYGSGYFDVTSCGAYGCTMSGAEAVCDFPASEPPDDALNTDGNFDAGGDDWHQNGGAVQLTSGMVCTNGEGPLELGWPVDVADAALLAYQQPYILKFRTSLVLAESWGFGSLDVKVGGPAEPYVEYFSELDIMIPEGIQDYSYGFTMQEPTGSAGIVLMLVAASAEFCVDEIWLVPGSG
jgi:Cys-rich repeat protein